MPQVDFLGTGDRLGGDESNGTRHTLCPDAGSRSFAKWEPGPLTPLYKDRPLESRQKYLADRRKAGLMFRAVGPDHVVGGVMCWVKCPIISDRAAASTRHALNVLPVTLKSFKESVILLMTSMRTGILKRRSIAMRWWASAAGMTFINRPCFFHQSPHRVDRSPA